MRFMNAVLPMLVLFAWAAHADNSQSQSGDQPHGKPPAMTDAQKACFTSNGLTAPGEGERPKTKPDHATMEKVHACLKANGFNPPDHPHHHHDGGNSSESGESSSKS